VCAIASAVTDIRCYLDLVRATITDPQDGDKILIGVSGGKDSLTLVHVMHYLCKNYRWLGVKFEFGCVTVDPGT
jgi:tRNA(Ile)-lysidine synthase TilS/MesJ